jgi:hypothetical protein
MKINFAPIILLAALAILFSGTVSAENTELIKDPSLKDLQGHWQGTSRADRVMASSSTKTVQMTFAGTKATYSSETGGYVAGVTIKGEEINITTASGKTSNTCKLSKASNTLILNCSWDMAANPQYKISKAYSGTLRLEKDK